MNQLINLLGEFTMKRFKACPGCGVKGKKGGLCIAYNVYHCYDCHIDFCSFCSREASMYFVSGTVVCPNHIRRTKEHNTKLIGEFVSGTFI